jgi:hypothetical protein
MSFPDAWKKGKYHVNDRLECGKNGRRVGKIERVV